MQNRNRILQQALTAAQTPIEQIDALNQLAYELRYPDPRRALDYARNAQELAQTVHPPYPKGHITSLINLADLYERHGQYQASLAAGQEALAQSQQAQLVPQEILALGKVAGTNIRLGHFGQALEYLQRQLTLATEWQDQPNILIAHNMTGILYSEIGDYATAFEYLQKTVELSRRYQDKLYEGVALNNYAWTKTRTKEYDEALALGLQALELNQQMDNQNILGFLYSTLALASLGLEQYDAAAQFLSQNQERLRQTANTKAQTAALHVRGLLALQMDALAEAEACFVNGLQLATESESPADQYEFHEALAKTYERLQQERLALHHYRQFHELKETILSERSKHRLQVLEMTYQAKTAQKKAEILRQKAEELEIQVVKRTQALTQQSQALQESLWREKELAQRLKATLAKESEVSRLKSQIIRVVSHEFRTPLAVINTSTDLLRNYADRLSAEKKETHHQRIKESIYYLSNLLQDVVLVNASNTAKLQVRLTAVSFADFCQSLSDNLPKEFGILDNVHFHFDAANNSTIVVDTILTKQIVTNLLSNALKYRRQATPVHITLTCNSTELEVAVADQGIGIPVAEQDKVFGLFYRAQNVGSRRGMGLGLHIVQTIVELLAGRIMLSSVGEDQGATFYVWLPVSQALEVGHD